MIATIKMRVNGSAALPEGPNQETALVTILAQSFMIMLCKIIHANMISLIVQRSHCRTEFFWNLKPRLQYAKGTLDILSGTFLALSIVIFHLPNWLMDRLYEVRPQRVNTICKKVESRIDMSIYMEAEITAFSSKHVGNKM